MTQPKRMGRPRTAARAKNGGVHILLWPTWKDFLRRRARDPDVEAFQHLSGKKQIEFFIKLAGAAVLPATHSNEHDTRALLIHACRKIAPALTEKGLIVLSERTRAIETRQRVHDGKQKLKIKGERFDGTDIWKPAFGLKNPRKLSGPARDLLRDAVRWEDEMAAIQSRPEATKSGCRT